jgi:dynein heavy chain
MFDNIGGLRFEFDIRDRPVVSAMISCEGEAMEFREAVLVAGRVEDWMNVILKGMRVANRYLTKKAIYDYGKLRRLR